MKKILVLLALIVPVLANTHVIDESENPRYLFCLSAESGSYEGETLTLTGVPSVVYFSDRPYRIAGHISLGEFVELWGEGTDNFEADPPNATLSIFDEQGYKNVVIEISNPVLMKGTISFTADILQGSIPASFSAGTLFIDNTAPYPLSSPLIVD
ncbi:MAG: hypothetical protein GY771_17400 [bacterium]|nr:hypothetical protein [bacterium]